MKSYNGKLKGNCLDKKFLLDLILSKAPLQYHKLIINAVKDAEIMYQGETRLSGEEFIYHPLNVAAIVAEMGLDVNSIITAIFHNVYKGHSSEELKEILNRIEEVYGKEVVSMIETIDRFSLGTRSGSDPKSITRYITSTSTDIRPLIIKVADRLHNARTIDSCSKSQQRLIAQNIINIYSQLCTFLNLYDFKRELEETAFRILKPKQYGAVRKHLEGLDIEEPKVLPMIRKEIVKILDKDENALIYGRIKGPYSIFKKLSKRKNRRRDATIEEIEDLIAFTVITQKEEDLYSIAKKIMKNTDFDLAAYDDYIHYPKSNGYKALHITTRFPKITNLTVEIQVKTEEMHQFNTYGPASHIVYKVEKDQSGTHREYYWMKQLHKDLFEYRKLKKGLSSPIKADIFRNKVYVFTPKGKLVELPLGATAVDYAYEIHSDLGNRMTGCKINHKKAQVRSMLNTGDSVEIIVDETQKLPNYEWLRFVRTRKAREAIENAYTKASESVRFTHTV